jgi:ribonuclease-3
MVSALEKSLGYRFENPKLLEQALTHPSLGRKQNNQRLEFLGDSVLGTVVARMLYEHFPRETEGALARRHAALVCGAALVKMAHIIGLPEHMKLAPSEAAAGGRLNPTNLEDACEAVIGALFLDGGYAAAEKFIVPLWEPIAAAEIKPPKDAKTGLQEWAQGRALPLPDYKVTRTEGPAHQPRFTIELTVHGYSSVTAEASTKRAAEQKAAQQLLHILENGKDSA